MDHKKKLKLKIFENEYSLLVENEEIAGELARYVTKVMEDTRNALPDQPVQTIAVIASMNIAYELFLEKNKFQEFNKIATDKLNKLKLLLNESNVSVPS